MRKKKEIRKIPEENLFDTYAAWETYVKSHLEKQEVEKLNEFFRFLKNLSRRVGYENTINNNLILPFCVGLMTGCFIPLLFKIDWNFVTDIQVLIVEKFSLIQETSGRMKANFLFGLFVFYGLSIFVAVIGLCIYLIFSVCKDIFSSRLKRGFYEDYIEIVNDVIKEKIDEETFVYKEELYEYIFKENRTCISKRNQ